MNNFWAGMLFMHGHVATPAAVAALQGCTDADIGSSRVSPTDASVTTGRDATLAARATPKEQFRWTSLKA